MNQFSTEEAGSTFMRLLVIGMILFCVGALLLGFGDKTGQQNSCYADAQSQLSPQWSNAGTIDRAVAAFSVVTTCEGGRP